MNIVGFDFGTTNSLISKVTGGRVINYTDDITGLPYPSVVCYRGGQVIVGSQAKQLVSQAGLGIQDNIIVSPKFELGKESIFVEGVQRSPVDIVSDVVGFVVSEAVNSSRGGQQIDKAVVTIPVDFEGYRRAALREAFQKAGVGVVQFVHEPLAALYGFFRGQKDFEETLREFNKKLVLVFDWGGGTLDLTLCKIIDGNLYQLKNDGTDQVGGDMFDYAIQNAVVERVSKDRDLDDVDVSQNSKKRFRAVCERAKIDLSAKDKVNLYEEDFFQNIDGDPDLDYQLTRTELENIVTPILEKGIRRIRSLLEMADVEPSEIYACIATGGMANMPAIKARLHEIFGPQRVRVSEKSATMIAEGAAWMAYDEAQLHLGKRVELLLARNNRVPLINADIPMPKESEVFEDKFSTFCVDPRDGYAKFQIESPLRPGKKILNNDLRVTLANMVLKVDENADPFKERLSINLKLDDNLILFLEASSDKSGEASETEIHELEFSLKFPDINASSDGGEEDSIIEIPDSEAGSPGELTMRSNLSQSDKDYSMIPGELARKVRPQLLNRMNPSYSEMQAEEDIYYQHLKAASGLRVYKYR